MKFTETLKIGDKVRCLTDNYYSINKGEVYTISGGVPYAWDLGPSGYWILVDEEWDKIVDIDSKEEAIKLLTDSGYTIDINGCLTPPKPKVTGWVNIYWLNRTSAVYAGSYCETKEVADTKANDAAGKRIACIQFTEGDGL